MPYLPMPFRIHNPYNTVYNSPPSPKHTYPLLQTYALFFLPTPLATSTPLTFPYPHPIPKVQTAIITALPANTATLSPSPITLSNGYG